ncbi:hypothetical protein [Fluviispira multicolorata]|uniref:Uncharacterized protein n=1 Tax=Fluviispira multicolorata TaxID=2654512 RepID=A0A833JEN7_9BACT|nr:hypothetical protein [Fluviispira multicolorata]KAB8029979.1 hypothetical protein GCL57_10610 [Fluviispira multicolorata]
MILIKKFHKHLLLLRNFVPHFMSYFILILFINSCVATKDNSKKILNSISTPFYMINTPSSTLQFSYQDLNPYVVNGLGWTPIILPTESHIQIQPSDFLVAYWQERDDPVLPPLEGSCRFINDSINETSSAANKGPLKLVTFNSDSVDPSKDAGEVFFLLNSETLRPFAMLKLNVYGQAKCFVSQKTFRISSGFGQLRNEKESIPNSSEQTVAFSENSFIAIEPLRVDGIYEGDLLRIGRSLSANVWTNLKDKFNESGFLIPSKINNDLFIAGNFQSKKMGVDEYMKSSILIGKMPFKIKLETSSYQVAVFRKNKMVCLKTIELKPDEVYDFTCFPNEGQTEDDIFENEAQNYYFDPTFYPFSILDSKDFQSWAFSFPNNFLVTSPINIRDDYFNEELKSEKLKEFQFLFQNSNNNLTSILGRKYSINQLNKIKKTSLDDYYLGVNSLIISDYITSIRNLSQDFEYFGIPLGAVGEQSLALGAVPFSVFTKFTNKNLEEDFLSMSNIQASNGTLFKIFEPIPLTRNGGILSSFIQQRFRIRIVIPAWNSTNIVEMYINGKIHRRWILDRGDISKAYSQSIEETTSEKGAFTVRWIAWGEDFLPDFLNASNNTLPLVITRDYCIDTIGDGICHLEQQK